MGPVIGTSRPHLTKMGRQPCWLQLKGVWQCVSTCGILCLPTFSSQGPGTVSVLQRTLELTMGERGVLCPCHPDTGDLTLGPWLCSPHGSCDFLCGAPECVCGALIHQLTSLGMLLGDTFWFCYLVVYLLLGPVSCFVLVDLSFRPFSPVSERN